METKQDIVRFIDQIKYGRVSRREIMRMMAAAGLAVSLTPTGRLARADEGQPTVFTWTGYEAPEMWAAYKAKYNAAPNFSIWGDEEEAEAKMRAGFHPEMVMPCSYKVVKWNDSGFLRPIDVSRYGLVYAGAQKNLGPSGVTLVILRNDLLERVPKNLPAMLDYKVQARQLHFDRFF